MKKRMIAVLLAAGLSSWPALGADGDWQEEVAHLLNYVAESGCTFMRNNKEYDAAQARAHITRKYEHVKTRISSAEQFITYAASESSITGKKYEVTCGETTMLSREWLEKELRSFREAR